MGGGLPDLGAGSPPGGGGAGGKGGSNKLKAYNVWDVLEKILLKRS
jgi:hypothetical protein